MYVIFELLIYNNIYTIYTINYNNIDIYVIFIFKLIIIISLLFLILIIKFKSFRFLIKSKILNKKFKLIIFVLLNLVIICLLIIGCIIEHYLIIPEYINETRFFIR